MHVNHNIETTGDLTHAIAIMLTQSSHSGSAVFICKGTFAFGNKNQTCNFVIKYYFNITVIEFINVSQKIVQA